MNDRKCLECSRQLNGRADQKFCGDQCRSAYNNKNSLENNTLIHSVNRILKKNHSILTMLHVMGKNSATKADLQRKGYRFDFYTSTSISRNNKVCYFCYNHGFKELEHNKLVLVDLVLDDETDQNVKSIPIGEPRKTPIRSTFKELKGTDHYKLHLPQNTTSQMTQRAAH